MSEFNEICSICHLDLNDLQRTLNCNHIFHTECINRWLERRNTCPLCRTIVPNTRVIHTLESIQQSIALWNELFG